MLPRIALLVSIALASAAGTGCSSTPLDLEGNPSTSGLLLLDAYVAREVVFGIDIEDPLGGASVSSMADLDEWKPGLEFDEFIVFSGLPPGLYAPRKLATDSTFWNNWAPWNYYIQHHEIPEIFQRDVEAGQARYLGRLWLEEPSGFTGLRIRYRASYDPARERRAWKSLLGHLAPDSPWRPLVESRLAEVEAAARAGVPAPQ